MILLSNQFFKKKSFIAFSFEDLFKKHVTEDRDGVRMI